MNIIRRIFPAFVWLLGTDAHAQRRTGDDAGRQLRQMVLGTSARDLGLTPSAQFPKVFGVVMDWPVSGQIASVVALADGTTSLYTTAASGILGGHSHASVRSAGRAFIGVAEQFVGDAVPTTSYPYPTEDKLAFYLLCYDGVRLVSADLKSTRSGAGKHAALFNAGQDVLTQLRKSVGQ